jgi:hypothetical protein
VGPPDLQTPYAQRGRCDLWVRFDAADGLFRQVLGAGDMVERLGELRLDAGAGQGAQDTVELLARVTRLAAKVGYRLDPALVVDTGALGGFGRLGLCRGRHEGDERIADGLLHRVRGAAIEPLMTRHHP